jgi:hypothetical protein
VKYAADRRLARGNECGGGKRISEEFGCRRRRLKAEPDFDFE